MMRTTGRTVATWALFCVTGCGSASERSADNLEDSNATPHLGETRTGASSGDGSGPIDDEPTSSNPAVSDELTVTTWEEFKAQATRTGADGTSYFMVEGDIPILTESELRAYYDVRVRGVSSKGVLHLVPGSNTDDVWLNDDQLHLRYCVDTDPNTGFGASISGVTGVSAATMIEAMDEATRAWEQVANVQFEYDSDNNDNCGRTDPIPDSRYIKVSRDDTQTSACAFGPQSGTSWTCPGLDGNTIGVRSTYLTSGAPSGMTWPGAMMHELGHTLGLHHEQFHTNGGGCSAADTRNVTASADLQSIMGYTLGSGGCALTTPSLTQLSEGDGITARALYGMPAGWYMAFL